MLLSTGHEKTSVSIITRGMINTPHLSFWAQQEHFNVLAAPPGALGLPDQVRRRIGAHARIRRPDLTEITSVHSTQATGATEFDS